ncbi:MAG: FMN-binding protein [Firmicutes bacterium]|nr:FMN-binding protein [Bacillota bacterium]
MKNNAFKEYIAPVVVLVAICLVVTGLLAFVNSITAPIIEENSIKAANEARAELLPAADTFTAFDGELAVVEDGKIFATECYIADNGSGMVVTVKTKSFGGLLTEMIGLDANGKITGVKVTAHGDTPGLGTKAHDPNYLTQYVGLSEATDVTAKGDANVTHVSGATISSNAVHAGVYAALEQQKIVGGAK